MPLLTDTLYSHYPALGELLEYPDGSLADRCARALECLDAHPETAAALRNFLACTEHHQPEALEELYTHTFLTGHLCTPYISVHLFGAENRKRAELMCGLAERYRQSGFERASELPDYLPLILRFFPRFDPEERREMVRYCLLKPVALMKDVLARAENPYEHLLRGLELALRRDFPEEVPTC